MSRGAGWVERAILDLFREHPDKNLSSIGIAALCLAIEEITDSQHSSFCRALRRLVRRGALVDLGRRWRDGRRRYRLPGSAPTRFAYAMELMQQGGTQLKEAVKEQRRQKRRSKAKRDDEPGAGSGSM
jgi:hypothetical protein